jgi:hypothetical protein
MKTLCVIIIAGFLILGGFALQPIQADDNYGESYRAVVIHSSAHDRRRQKRIERRLLEEKKALTEKCNKAAKVEYFCREDAETAANKFSEEPCTYYEIRPRLKKSRSMAKVVPEKTAFGKSKKCGIWFQPI